MLGQVGKALACREGVGPLSVYAIAGSAAIGPGPPPNCCSHLRPERDTPRAQNPQGLWEGPQDAHPPAYRSLRSVPSASCGRPESSCPDNPPPCPSAYLSAPLDPWGGPRGAPLSTPSPPLTAAAQMRPSLSPAPSLSMAPPRPPNFPPNAPLATARTAATARATPPSPSPAPPAQPSTPSPAQHLPGRPNSLPVHTGHQLDTLVSSWRRIWHTAAHIWNAKAGGASAQRPFKQGGPRPPHFPPSASLAAARTAATTRATSPSSSSAHA
jgi:hypothetical protein